MCCVSVLNVDKGPWRWVFYPLETNRLVNKQRYAQAKNDSHKASQLKRFSVERRRRTLRQFEYVRSEFIPSSHDFHIHFIFLSFLLPLLLHIIRKLNSYGYIHFSLSCVSIYSVSCFITYDTGFPLSISFFLTNVLWINPFEMVNAHAKKIGQKVKTK